MDENKSFEKYSRSRDKVLDWMSLNLPKIASCLKELPFKLARQTSSHPAEISTTFEF
jgi:hypothetical protein